MTDVVRRLFVRWGYAAPKLEPMPPAVWETELSREDVEAIFVHNEGSGGSGKDALVDPIYKEGLSTFEAEHEVPLPKPDRTFIYHPIRPTEGELELWKLAELAKTLGLKPKVSSNLAKRMKEHTAWPHGYRARFTKQGKIVQTKERAA